MEYGKIVAVSGMPGLYEILNSKGDGAIVRSLDDGNTKFVSSRVHNLSHLESIEIYTTEENVALSDIFQAMKSNSESLPNVKDAAALRAYFDKVYPQLDQDRVYTSDMKKMITWFSALEKHNIDYTAAPEEPVEEEAEEVPAETKAPSKAAKKEKKKPAAEMLKASDEKAVLDVKEDTVPEVAKTKTTKTRKKKTEE